MIKLLVMACLASDMTDCLYVVPADEWGTVIECQQNTSPHIEALRDELGFHRKSDGQSVVISSACMSDLLLDEFMRR